MIRDLNDDKIKEIAHGIYTGEIFTNIHVHKSDTHLLSTIFTPLIFMDEKNLEGVGLIYEYMCKASARSINGYPIFFSLNIVNKTDTAKIQDKYIKIKKAVDDV